VRLGSVAGADSLATPVFTNNSRVHAYFGLSSRRSAAFLPVSKVVELSRAVPAHSPN
jgi:hypothetical protein